MSFTRYDTRRILINDNEQYKELFRKRNVNFIRHHETAKFKYPTSEQIQELTVIGKIWSIGDSYWKLAAQYYGEPEYHWVISFYNLKPEYMVQLGETIYVPLPLDKILRFFGV